MRADSLSLNYCFHSKGLDGGSSVKILNRFTIFFFLGWQLYQRMEPGKYGTSMVSLFDTTIFRQSCPLYWLYRFVPPQKARFLSGFWIVSELILGTVSKKSQGSMFILLVFSGLENEVNFTNI